MIKIVQISRQNKLPLFSSDPDSVKQGALGCVGYTQYAVGRMAGKLLAQVLEGHKLLKIQRPAEPEVFINETSAKIFGLNIPSSILGMTVNKVK
ncbi:MAG: ABC transporter substrate binding protein [Pseudomonadota bacterium]